jgi:hypothetical protein
MDKIIEEIKRIEYEEIDYWKESNDYYGFKKGKIPILISAPHGARHLRNGKWKEEDEYTASIAIKLADLTGAHAIYVKNATREDPNFDIECKYKEEIKKISKNYGIRFIADLHGAKLDRNFKISVGIINTDSERCSCPTFKDLIQEAFSVFQKDVFNLDGFSASSLGTITYFAKNTLELEAAQFEINARYRIVERKSDSTKSKAGIKHIYSAKENDILELIKALTTMLNDIKKIVMLGERDV